MLFTSQLYPRPLTNQSSGIQNDFGVAEVVCLCRVQIACSRCAVVQIASFHLMKQCRPPCSAALNITYGGQRCRAHVFSDTLAINANLVQNSPPFLFSNEVKSLILSFSLPPTENSFTLMNLE